MWLIRVTTCSAQPGPMLLWRSKHGLTGRTCSAKGLYMTNAAGIMQRWHFQDNALRGEMALLGFFTFQMLQTHGEIVSLVLHWPWKCRIHVHSRKTADAYMMHLCSVCYRLSTPNSCVWIWSTVLDCCRPRSLSMACSPDRRGIRGCTGSSTIPPKLNNVWDPWLCFHWFKKKKSNPQTSNHKWTCLKTHILLWVCLFSVSLHVSLGSSCSHHVIVKQVKAHTLTGISLCTSYMSLPVGCAMWERNVATTAAAQAAS